MRRGGINFAIATESIEEFLASTAGADTGALDGGTQQAVKDAIWDYYRRYVQAFHDWNIEVLRERATSAMVSAWAPLVMQLAASALRVDTENLNIQVGSVRRFCERDYVLAEATVQFRGNDVSFLFFLSVARSFTPMTFMTSRRLPWSGRTVSGRWLVFDQPMHP